MYRRALACLSNLPSSFLGYNYSDLMECLYLPPYLEHDLEHHLDYELEHDVKYDLEHDLPHALDHDFELHLDPELEHDLEHDLPYPLEHDLEHDLEHEPQQALESDFEPLPAVDLDQGSRRALEQAFNEYLANLSDDEMEYYTEGNLHSSTSAEPNQEPEEELEQTADEYSAALPEVTMEDYWGQLDEQPNKEHDLALQEELAAEWDVDMGDASEDDDSDGGDWGELEEGLERELKGAIQEYELAMQHGSDSGEDEDDESSSVSSDITLSPDADTASGNENINGLFDDGPINDNDHEDTQLPPAEPPDNNFSENTSLILDTADSIASTPYVIFAPMSSAEAVREMFNARERERAGRAHRASVLRHFRMLVRQYYMLTMGSEPRHFLRQVMELRDRMSEVVDDEEGLMIELARERFKKSQHHGTRLNVMIEQAQILLWESEEPKEEDTDLMLLPFDPEPDPDLRAVLARNWGEMMVDSS